MVWHGGLLGYGGPMLANVRRRSVMGLLVALALFVVSFAPGSGEAGTARAEHPARVAAVAHTATVFGTVGHVVERAAWGVGHRDLSSPAPGGSPAVAALLLLALVATAVSGVAGGLGRRCLRDRAPPVLS